MICLANGQYQPGIFYLQNYEFQRNTHFFFLDLNVSTDIPTAKRVTRKTKYILFLLLGILDCNTKTRNETAGYYCINFKIVTFGNALVIMNIELQHRGINFWIVTFGKIKILNNFSRTWMSPQTTNNIISPLGLNFEFPMGNDRRKLNWLHLTIYLSNGNSVQLITKF